MLLRLIACSGVIAGAALLGTNAVTAANHEPTPREATSTGMTIALKMQRALLHARHLEAVGTLTQGNVPATKVRYRFESPDRESIVRFGGLLTRVKIAGRALSQEREVTIGKTLYQSIDGKHWSTGPRAVAPSTLDVLTLNGANIACCNATVTSNGNSVSSGGMQKLSGTSVYILNFRAADRGDVVTTRVTLSASTYLPLSYTATSQPPRAVSQMTIRYSTKFKIAQPR